MVAESGTSRGRAGDEPRSQAGPPTLTHMASPRMLLLDSASLYFRAFYGVPDQRESADEPPTNAVRGFLDMIATLVNAHRPTELVACWDDDWRPQWRVDLIPTYKTHRLTEGSDVQEESPDDLTPQVPLIRDALSALGIARLGAPGFEAGYPADHWPADSRRRWREAKAAWDVERAARARPGDRP